MSLDILECILKAEENAERVRVAAFGDARDIIKEAESACVARERDYSIQMRSLYQTLLDQKRNLIENQLIKVREVKKAERDIYVNTALERLENVAEYIYKGVINGGDY
jgi:vacuolar-type H+-ATPase subunit H